MAATIEPAVREFIARQHVFFVATAPLAKDGHINVSPKGLDSLRVLDERTVAYVDLTGSGAETIAHLRENGRITLMFCAFEGDPKIVRVYGRGEAIEPDHPEFGVLLKHFRNWPGLRAIIRIHVERVAQSCGYGVPLYQFVGDRSRLIDWAQQKGPQGLRDYQQRHNRWSIDGLPGLRMAAGSTRGDDSSTTSSSSS
ncbi:MAG: pyridoxamine 5'-phosphate oxidase [Candidatus Binatia bacterium]|nr:MAG: pyridoxamine 5'-phosphate oxidase [Candidatus Binatia bacterium]